MLNFTRECQHELTRVIHIQNQALSFLLSLSSEFRVGNVERSSLHLNVDQMSRVRFRGTSHLVTIKLRGFSKTLEIDQKTQKVKDWREMKRRLLAEVPAIQMLAATIDGQTSDVTEAVEMMPPPTQDGVPRFQELPRCGDQRSAPDTSIACDVCQAFDLSAQASPWPVSSSLQGVFDDSHQIVFHEKIDDSFFGPW
jgi:hypothetical protein